MKERLKNNVFKKFAKKILKINIFNIFTKSSFIYDDANIKKISNIN